MSYRRYIYFAQPVTGGNVKIGFSERPRDRLEQLMEWSPEKLTILATAPGDQGLEGRVHLHFIEHWSHHEWFRPAPELLAFVRIVKETSAIPTDGLPTSAPYRLLPRKQQGPRSPEARRSMEKARKFNKTLKQRRRA